MQATDLHTHEEGITYANAPRPRPAPPATYGAKEARTMSKGCGGEERKVLADGQRVCGVRAAHSHSRNRHTHTGTHAHLDVRAPPQSDTRQQAWEGLGMMGDEDEEQSECVCVRV